MAWYIDGKGGAPLVEVGVAVLPGIVGGTFKGGGLKGAPGGANVGGMVGAETYPANKKIETFNAGDFNSVHSLPSLGILNSIPRLQLDNFYGIPYYTY